MSNAGSFQCMHLTDHPVYENKPPKIAVWRMTISYYYVRNQIYACFRDFIMYI